MEKKEAIKIVREAAKRYQNNLVGKKILVLYLGCNQCVDYFELSFKATNFLHLTGLQLVAHISAAEFYKRCLDGKLSESDFEFAEDGTTILKLTVLPKLMANNLSANMIGDFNSNSLKLYTEKLVGSVTACLGFVKQGDAYYPNTLLYKDIRNVVYETKRIVAIFQKKFKDLNYGIKTFQSKTIDCGKLKFPQDVEYLKGLLITEDK